MGEGERGESVPVAYTARPSFTFASGVDGRRPLRPPPSRAREVERDEPVSNRRDRDSDLPLSMRLSSLSRCRRPPSYRLSSRSRGRRSPPYRLSSRSRCRRPPSNRLSSRSLCRRPPSYRLSSLSRGRRSVISDVRPWYLWWGRIGGDRWEEEEMSTRKRERRGQVQSLQHPHTPIETQTVTLN